MQSSEISQLSFNSNVLGARIFRDAVEVPVDRPSVVINIAMSDAYTAGSQPSPLPPLSSTNLISGRVTGDLLVVLDIPDATDVATVPSGNGWDSFYGDGGPILLKSSQDTIGTVNLDLGAVLHQTGLPARTHECTIKANLWFSPGGTDCGIHNQHAFVEVHTQVSGLGRMQKFMTRDAASLYEDQQLSPGTTNPVPFCVDVDGALAYPWHQYKADTDCIWLALEYHKS